MIFFLKTEVLNDSDQNSSKTWKCWEQLNISTTTESWGIVVNKLGGTACLLVISSKFGLLHQ